MTHFVEKALIAFSPKKLASIFESGNRFSSRMLDRQTGLGVYLKLLQDLWLIKTIRISTRGKLGGQNFCTFDTRKFSKIFEIRTFDTSNFLQKNSLNFLKLPNLPEKPLFFKFSAPSAPKICTFDTKKKPIFLYLGPPPPWGQGPP